MIQRMMEARFNYTSVLFEPCELVVVLDLLLVSRDVDAALLQQVRSCGS